MLPEIASCFDTTLTLDPNLSQAELEAEIARLVRRQEAIYSLLDGSAHIDTVEAMLAEDGIDPYQWAAVGEQNLLYFLDITDGLAPT